MSRRLEHVATAPWWRRRWKTLTTSIAFVAAIVGYIVTVGFPLAGAVASHRDKPASPLTLSAVHDPGVLADGWAVVVQDRARAASTFVSSQVRDCNSLRQAAQRLQAFDAGETYIDLIAEGSGPRTSTIIGIRARVLSSTRPAAGAIADCPSGGAEGVIPMRLDLDSPDPIAMRVKEIKYEGLDTDTGRVIGSYFATKAIAVHAGETVPIRIEATTAKASVTWDIQVTAIVAGRQRTFVLDEGGQPFRTTPESNLSNSGPDYRWDWGARPPKLVVLR